MSVTPPEVFADRKLPCEALFRIVAAAGMRRFGLAVIARDPEADKPVPDAEMRALGELAPLANRTTSLLAFTIETQHGGASISARVLPDGLMAMSVDGRGALVVTTAVEQRDEVRRRIIEAAEGPHSNTQPFAVEYGRTCTVGDLANVIATLDDAMPASIWSGRVFRIQTALDAEK